MASSGRCSLPAAVTPRGSPLPNPAGRGPTYPHSRSVNVHHPCHRRWSVRQRSAGHVSHAPVAPGRPVTAPGTRRGRTQSTADVRYGNGSDSLGEVKSCRGLAGAVTGGARSPERTDCTNFTDLAVAPAAAASEVDGDVLHRVESARLLESTLPRAVQRPRDDLRGLHGWDRRCPKRVWLPQAPPGPRSPARLPRWCLGSVPRRPQAAHHAAGPHSDGGGESASLPSPVVTDRLHGCEQQPISRGLAVRSAYTPVSATPGRDTWASWPSPTPAAQPLRGG